MNHPGPLVWLEECLQKYTLAVTCRCFKCFSEITPCFGFTPAETCVCVCVCTVQRTKHDFEVIETELLPSSSVNQLQVTFIGGLVKPSETPLNMKRWQVRLPFIYI